MNIAIILDWAMAVMLIISITYSWRLNKKIMDFKSNKGEFFQLIKILDETIIKAENNIEELKKLSFITSNNLGTKLDSAKTAVDELAFMSDRAISLSNKLEDFIKNSRKYENLYRNSDIMNQQYSSIDNQNLRSNKEKTKFQEPKAAAIESLLAKISALKTKREIIDN